MDGHHEKRNTKCTWDLAYPSLEFAIARCHHVALVLLHAVHKAVICVGALWKNGSHVQDEVLARTAERRADWYGMQASRTLCSHGSLSKRGSFAKRSATLNFGPIFSNSPITQSVIVGMHLASRQSIMDLWMSSLFCGVGN